MLKIKKMPNLIKWKKEINDSPSKLSSLANQIIVEIRQNTRSGKDKMGAGFKPYDRTYAEVKKKEFGSGKVNLTRTGRMLNAITSKPVTRGVIIYFNNKAENDKAYYNSEVLGRKFFGISWNRFKSYYLPKLRKMYKF